MTSQIINKIFASASTHFCPEDLISMPHSPFHHNEGFFFSLPNELLWKILQLVNYKDYRAILLLSHHMNTTFKEVLKDFYSTEKVILTIAKLYQTDHQALCDYRIIYRKTPYYLALKNKADKSDEEKICYALTTDNVTDLNVDDLRSIISSMRTPLNKVIPNNEKTQTIVALSDRLIEPVLEILRAIDIVQPHKPHSFRSRSRVSIENKDLNGINLAGINLSKTIFTLVNLSFADLSGAELKDTSIYRSNFTGAVLVKASLLDSTLSDVNFTKANLACADLRFDQTWQGDKLNFVRADLSHVKLSNALSYYTDFSGCNMEGAILSNVSLITSTDVLNEDELQCKLHQLYEQIITIHSPGAFCKAIAHNIITILIGETVNELRKKQSFEIAFKIIINEILPLIDKIRQYPLFTEIKGVFLHEEFLLAKKKIIDLAITEILNKILPENNTVLLSDFLTILPKQRIPRVDISMLVQAAADQIAAYYHHRVERILTNSGNLPDEDEIAAIYSSMSSMQEHPTFRIALCQKILLNTKRSIEAKISLRQQKLLINEQRKFLQDVLTTEKASLLTEQLTKMQSISACDKDKHKLGLVIACDIACFALKIADKKTYKNNFNLSELKDVIELLNAAINHPFLANVNLMYLENESSYQDRLLEAKTEIESMINTFEVDSDAMESESDDDLDMDINKNTPDINIAVSLSKHGFFLAKIDTIDKQQEMIELSFTDWDRAEKVVKKFNLNEEDAITSLFDEKTGECEFKVLLTIAQYATLTNQETKNEGLSC
jgi:uncharacterized protein YjbI with pentapeptide repeats